MLHNIWYAFVYSMLLLSTGIIRNKITIWLRTCLQENLAGAALRNLVKNKWRSNFSHQHPASPFATRNFRVHHGSYSVTVLHQGIVVYTTTTEVEKNKDVELDITLT